MFTCTVHMLCVCPVLADQATVFLYDDRGLVLSRLSLCCVGFATHSSSIAKFDLRAHVSSHLVVRLDFGLPRTK